MASHSTTDHVSIGLLNPKSPSNVGAVMRAAGCYQVDSVFYTGKRYARARQYDTDTKNIEERIPLTQLDCLLEDIPADCKVVCVELVEGATPLPLFEHPDKAYYLLGPEDGSLTQELVDRADEVIYVPTHGCMNLAATANVVLYDRLAKSERAAGSDALVRQSRDRNNNVRVKRHPSGQT